MQRYIIDLNTKIKFPDQLVLNFNEIKNNKKIIVYNSLSDTSESFITIRDLEKNPNLFVLDKYVKLETIHDIFKLDGICNVMNYIYLLNNEKCDSVVKLSHYSIGYYNWIVDNLFRLFVFIKLNYAYSDLEKNINSNFRLLNIIRGSYIEYWNNILNNVKEDNNLHHLIPLLEHISNHCDSKFDFNFIRYNLFHKLNNSYKYHNLIPIDDTNMFIDNERNFIFCQTLQKTIKYIIYSGLIRIIKVINNQYS